MMGFELHESNVTMLRYKLFGTEYRAPHVRIKQRHQIRGILECAFELGLQYGLEAAYRDMCSYGSTKLFQTVGRTGPRR